MRLGAGLVTASRAWGSSILINGKNLFYTTTLTPGLCQPTGFTVSYLQAPTIRSLTDPACAGTQIGFQLNGCRSVGGSMLTITETGFLPSTTVTTGLCSNVIWIDQNTLQCRLSSGITPGSTLSVVVNTPAGSSPASGISISF